MSAPNVHTGDPFSLESLTAAVNSEPYRPGQVSASGVFDEDGVTTTMISVEKRDGKLALVRQGEAGASVTLRFAMDTLVILHTCPHPLSRATAYPRQPLGIHIDGERKPLSALCLERAENQRGLCNNHLYHLSEGACSC